MATAYGDMGSQQGIRAVANGVNVGGRFRIYTGSGTPVATFSATEVGDLYLDYTNGILYIAKATGTGSWFPYAPGTSGAAASVADGGTITHGFGSTPTMVLVTGSVEGEMVTVSAIGATTFTVAIKTPLQAPGTTQTIYWRVE